MVLGLRVEVNRPQFKRLERRFGVDSIQPAIDEMMRDMGLMLRRRLRDSADIAFPQSQHRTLARSSFFEYNKGAGVLSVGFNTEGKADPVTGKPLADYIVPVQSFSGAEERTAIPNPPLVYINAEGKLRYSHVVTDRLTKWAASIGKPNPAGFARLMAQGIQGMLSGPGGVARKPVFSRVFRVFGAGAKSIDSAVHSDVLTDVRSIRGRAVADIIRRLST